MLCAFQEPPRILRLHGRGDDPRFRAEKKMRVGGKAEIEAYVAPKYTESINGLPAL